LPSESKFEEHFGLRYIATGEQTGGQYFQCATTVPAGDAGPPPHRHANESEGFYVRSGTLNLQVDGRQSLLSAGDFVQVPPNAVHTWSNDTDQPVELIITFCPAGIESMFRALDEVGADFVAIGAAYGMTVVE